jgi:hypothetical protein
MTVHSCLESEEPTKTSHVSMVEEPLWMHDKTIVSLPLQSCEVGDPASLTQEARAAVVQGLVLAG